MMKLTTRGNYLNAAAMVLAFASFSGEAAAIQIRGDAHEPATAAQEILAHHERQQERRAETRRMENEKRAQEDDNIDYAEMCQYHELIQVLQEERDALPATDFESRKEIDGDIQNARFLFERARNNAARRQSKFQQDMPWVEVTHDPSLQNKTPRQVFSAWYARNNAKKPESYANSESDTDEDVDLFPNSDDDDDDDDDKENIIVKV